VPETHEALASAMEGLAVHDHLCLIYESQDEQFAAVVPFMRHGLAAGQACMYIADDNTADAVGAALRSDGIDTDAESARGALRILTKRESYLRDGRFDPDVMIAFLAEATAEARADGFSALRVTGEMTWALGGEPGTERLFEYEAKLNYFFPDHDALAICQYNRSRFGPDVILNVIRTHPVVISGGLVCDNFHYVPPDDFLQRDQPSREVDKLLNSIVDAERSRQALEQASRDWSATFDAMNDMVCLLARDGTVLRCNESMVKLLGRRADEVLGKKCYEVMHGSRTFFEQCPYQEMLRTGKRESLELPLGERWYQVTTDPLFDEAEEIVGAVQVIRDITARRRAEEELRRAGAYNRCLIEASLDPLVTIGPDGMITDVNEATVTATGCTRDEMVGTDSADYVTEPARVRAGHEQILREGTLRDYPLEIRHRDGHVTAVLYNASTYRDASGKVAGVFAAARDVGALKRAEAEIRALNASLEQRVRERTRELAAANRELREFVYSVSHDLRSPLRAVDGFSQTVLEDYGDVIDEQGRSDLQRVRAAAQRMGAHMDALLALWRLGRREIDLGQVDLSAVARRVIGELREADPERQVDVVIEDGLVAEADSALVDVVLENLLGNAWKFTARRPSAHIEFGSIQRDGRPVFFVRDDGAGFDPAYVDKLFTPFQRLHTAEQFPGTGIGLAMIARVLGRLGGTWWAEGVVDRGATFYFTLSGGDAELPRAVE